MRAAAVALALAALVLGSGALAALAAQGPTVRAQPGGVAAADLSAPDPDLAMVAGLAQGPSVLGVPLGAAPARVLAVPAGAPTDLGDLQPTGRHFDFTDPNGGAWHVTEYRAAWGYAYGTATGRELRDPAVGAYNFVLLVDHTKVGEQLRLVAT